MSLADHDLGAARYRGSDAAPWAVAAHRIGSPLDDAAALARVRQVAGKRDATVPVETIRGAVEKLQPGARLVVVAEFDHTCCWLRGWPQLRAAAWRSTTPAIERPRPIERDLGPIPTRA